MNKIDKSRLKVTKLTNSRKSSLEILNFGATIFSFKIRSRDSKDLELVVGPREAEDYLKPEYYDANQCFGASIGRYAGRIANGRFSLGEDEFELFQKEGVHLHGGKLGFQYKIWDIEEVTDGPDPSVKLSNISEHLEEGYPGNLKVAVRFTLSENDEVKVSYTATTDRDTIVNLTNHVYWNLNGGGSVSDHFLHINSAKILELDAKNLPTGNLENLKDHPKSYIENRLIGNRKLDDVFIIDNGRDHTASLFSPLSGVKMKIRSNQPVLVVYVPEKLPQEWNYKSPVDSKFPAIALEAQNYPDAPNFRNFPSSELGPGETYQNEIVFSFSLR